MQRVGRYHVERPSSTHAEVLANIYGIAVLFFSLILSLSELLFVRKTAKGLASRFHVFVNTSGNL